MRRSGGALALAAIATLGAAGPAAAHALGRSFPLPVPLWLYLAGAGVAVGASFVVTAVVARAPEAEPTYRARPLPAGPAAAGALALRILGMLWWYGALAAGLLLPEATPLPAVLLWIGIWVALPMATVVAGNPWPSLSPLRTTFDLLEALARRLGVARLDAGLPWPGWLARWPAVALFFAVAWAELILPGSDGAREVAVAIGAYTLLSLVGMTLFGRGAWLRSAEAFEVYLGWLGRIGPLGRRSVDPGLCAGCGERCDPARCVDCPECAVVADRGERRPELRPWFVGLTEVRRAGWSDAALIILALATVTYDGLRETAAWSGPLSFLIDTFLAVLPPAAAFLAIDTAGMLAVAGTFAVAFALAVALARGIAGGGAPPIGASIGVYASTLLPIAAGYLIAHYLTLVLQGAAWLPGLLADPGIRDPTSLVAPSIDWFPISAVWYLSVGAIVLGHIVAIVLGHRIALRDAPSRAVPASLPLVAIMVGYTVLSLWIIAQPIVVEPGVPLEAAGPRA